MMDQEVKYIFQILRKTIAKNDTKLKRDLCKSHHAVEARLKVHGQENSFSLGYRMIKVTRLHQNHRQNKKAARLLFKSGLVYPVIDCFFV